MICSKCKTEKPLDQFNFKNKALMIYHGTCKECHKLETRAHYRNNKEQYFERNRRSKKEKIKWFHEYKATLSCEKCGEDDPICLDFHHSNNDKEFTVSAKKSGYTKTRLLKEINKCTVLCANCHRKLHRDMAT